MLRYFDGTQPKAVSYKATDQPWQAHYAQPSPRGHVIVEDQLSGLRAWQCGYYAVALLGVNLNQDKAAELRSVFSAGAWLLALDADAYGKALSYARRYSWVRAVRLEADIKDLKSDAAIQERLRD